MRKFVDYKPLTIDQEAALFAQCLPVGLAWNSKGDRETVLYSLLRSLADEINKLEEKLYEMVTQWDVRVTDSLITEWEVAVGIPDECRNISEEIAVRRSDVLDKLKKIPIITIADYKDLAESITGEPAANWNIRPGSEDFPDDLLFRFVLLITAPIVTSGAFQYPLGSGFESGIGITHNGSDTATATVTDTSTMEDGSIVTIAGANQSEYNGDFTITITGGTTFTYPVAGAPVTPATGTITVNFGIDQDQVDALADETQFLSTPGVAFPGYPFAGSFRTDILKCVFRKITPANVALVFD